MKLITLIAATTSAVKVMQNMDDGTSSMPEGWLNMPAPLIVPDPHHSEEIGSLYIEYIDQEYHISYENADSE